MKAHKRIIRLVTLFTFSLVFWSCLEYSITTQVLPDGRLLRTIVVKGDSTDIFKGSFSVPSDSSWSISTRYESRENEINKDVVEGRIFVYEARKEFGDYLALNREFDKESAVKDHINIRVDFKKRFRWFYNYYYYTETYGRLFPFNSVPVSRYLTETELKIHQADEKDIYYSPKDDRILLVQDSLNLPVLSKSDSLRFKALRDTIELKFESWQKINIYNDFFHLVTASLGKLGIRVDTAAERGSFYRWLDQKKTFESGIENDRAFIQAASDYFKVEPARLQSADPAGFNNFHRKFRVATYSLETYTSKVLMPGLIIRTNADKTDVNLANWTFKIENFYADDYSMNVESRMVNSWFVIISGLILVAIIALILLRLFRRRIAPQ